MDCLWLLREFESISEKYSGPIANFVVGYVKLSSLMRIKSLIPKLEVFIAFTNNFN